MRLKKLEKAKQDYVDGEVESSWGDHKFMNEILYYHFYNQVKDLNRENFIDFLEDLGCWEREEVIERFFGEKGDE